MATTVDVIDASSLCSVPVWLDSVRIATIHRNRAVVKRHLSDDEPSDSDTSGSTVPMCRSGSVELTIPER